MKTTTLFYCLLIFMLPSVKGQVYMVGNLADQIILSPENVDTIMPEVCLHHLATIVDYGNETESTLASLHADFNKISQESNSKRKTKQLSKEIAVLQKEVGVLNDFREKWFAVSDEETKLLLFYEKWQKDSCLNIVTSEGTYLPDEYELEIKAEEETSGAFRESFAVQYTKGGHGWEKKKKSLNCISLKEEDCYVLCSVILPEKAEFFDCSNAFQVIEGCPLGFGYNEVEGKCERVSFFSYEKPVIQITKKSDGKVLSLKEWRKVDCEE
ncbi:MAG: hypothetical protein ACI94Y_002216 [Maribacter sp.]|jgi:hypothetical protein